MRTTLDIDPRVLAAARASVHAGKHVSLGEAVSALALAGLSNLTSPSAASTHGLVLLPSVSGRVVTDEMVTDAALDD